MVNNFNIFFLLSMFFFVFAIAYILVFGIRLLIRFKNFQPELQKKLSILKENPEAMETNPALKVEVDELVKNILGPKMYDKIIEAKRRKGIDPYVAQSELNLGKPQSEFHENKSNEFARMPLQKFFDENVHFICPFCGTSVKKGKDTCPKCKNVV